MDRASVGDARNEYSLDCLKSLNGSESSFGLKFSVLSFVSVPFTCQIGNKGRDKMIRLIVFAALALAVATSAEAMSPALLHGPDGMITQVREACGAGRVRINGVCVARTTTRHVRRAVRRCAGWSEGFCTHYH